MNCFNEVAATCNSFGQYASAYPMCHFDWSRQESLLFDSSAMMRIIRASAVTCKHPYEFNVTELVSFLGATNFHNFQDAFTAQRITGAQMTELTLEQLTEKLDLPLGDSMSFISGKTARGRVEDAKGLRVGT